MSDEELLQWAALLAKDRSGQIKVIQDLMKHAADDGMSAEDRTSCRRALVLLGRAIEGGEVA